RPRVLRNGGAAGGTSPAMARTGRGRPGSRPPSGSGTGLPSSAAMTEAAARNSDMRLLDLEDIGLHYATTLRAWRENFHARLADVRALGYPEPFIRMWDYYLCYCEAAFLERAISDVHMVFSRPGFRQHWP
ncbi:MAG: class I SAM-dependent methyltransferase, partial [Xanthomonadales bacterium]|nr:class I SAM-dependent methyltransferase [Xanthomonadales bacterium]